MPLTRSDLLLKLAQEIGDLVNHATDLDRILQDVVDRIAESLHFDVVSVYLWDEQNQDLVLRATHGLTVDPNQPVRLKSHEGLTGLAYQTRRTLVEMPASKHPRYKFIPGIGEESYESFLGVPLMLQDRSMGVLVGQNREERFINPAEETLFQIIASRLAGLLEVADRLERLSHEAAPPQQQTRAYQGKGLTTGCAVGRVHVVHGMFARARAMARRPGPPEHERKRLEAALSAASRELHELHNSLPADSPLSGGGRSIIEAHISFLDDPGLRESMTRRVARGTGAEMAVMEAIEEVVQQFDRLNAPYLRERSQDIRDLGERILSQLVPCPPDVAGCGAPEDGAVLVAHDIGPAALLMLHRHSIAAVVTEQGGETSHTAILAKSLGVPAVSGVEDIVRHVTPGEELLVDGRTGFVFANPDQQLISEYRATYQRLDELKRVVAVEEERRTPLKVPLALSAAIGFPADVGVATENGLRDVGLFRTEFHYMQFDRWPTQEEQVPIYQQIAANLSGTITVRTLDIGGDKRLPYLKYPAEDNPLLGLRSIRHSMENLQFFRSQIAAILTAHAETPRFRILLPMVTDVWEVESAREILVEQGRHLGLSDTQLPPLGIMAEVPGIVQQLSDYKDVAAFVAVGLNDLIQYLLAVDRGSSIVGHLYSGFHPAVLRTLDVLRRTCDEMDKEVVVCGEMAASPAGALALMALGYFRFGLLPIRAPIIRHLARRVSPEQLEGLRSLLLQTPKQSTILGRLQATLESLDPLLLAV